MPRYRVATTVLNLRSSPDSSGSSNIIGKLDRGTKVESTPVPAGQPTSPDWEFVSVTDKGQTRRGYVAKRLIVEIRPASLAWCTGVNMREFAFFGTPVVPFTTTALQDAQLAALRSLGVKVVRIFGTHVSMSTSQVINQLRTALVKIGGAGMRAIVCLNDGLGSGFFPKGDEAFHNQVQGHVNREYFTQNGYRTHFVPQVKAITEALAASPHILMWELGNEFAIHPQPAVAADGEAFLRFADEVGELIKRATPRVLVSTGLVNTNHIAAPGPTARGTFARRLYSLDSMDVISIHYYQHDGEKDKADFDAQIAKALKKPYYIGEVGAFHHIGPRAGYYDAELGEWKGKGACMVLPWAFDVSPVDVGIGDELAMARRFDDFDGNTGVLARYRA
jgi:hypothetical protein